MPRITRETPNLEEINAFIAEMDKYIHLISFALKKGRIDSSFSTSLIDLTKGIQELAEISTNERTNSETISQLFEEVQQKTSKVFEELSINGNFNVRDKFAMEVMLDEAEDEEVESDITSSTSSYMDMTPHEELDELIPQPHNFDFEDPNWLPIGDHDLWIERWVEKRINNENPYYEAITLVARCIDHSDSYELIDTRDPESLIRNWSSETPLSKEKIEQREREREEKAKTQEESDRQLGENSFEKRNQTLRETMKVSRNIEWKGAVIRRRLMSPFTKAKDNLSRALRTNTPKEKPISEDLCSKVSEILTYLSNTKETGKIRENLFLFAEDHNALKDFDTDEDLENYINQELQAIKHMLNSILKEHSEMDSIYNSDPYRADLLFNNIASRLTFAIDRLSELEQFTDQYTISLNAKKNIALSRASIMTYKCDILKRKLQRDIRKPNINRIRKHKIYEKLKHIQLLENSLSSFTKKRGNVPAPNRLIYFYETYCRIQSPFLLKKMHKHHRDKLDKLLALCPEGTNLYKEILRKRLNLSWKIERFDVEGISVNLKEDQWESINMDIQLKHLEANIRMLSPGYITRLKGSIRSKNEEVHRDKISNMTKVLRDLLKNKLKLEENGTFREWKYEARSVLLFVHDRVLQNKPFYPESADDPNTLVEWISKNIPSTTNNMDTYKIASILYGLKDFPFSSDMSTKDFMSMIFKGIKQAVKHPEVYNTRRPNLYKEVITAGPLLADNLPSEERIKRINLLQARARNIDTADPNKRRGNPQNRNQPKPSSQQLRR